MTVLYNFEATSESSGEVYLMEFSKAGDKVKFGCTCKAGQSGQYCKHRIAILEGDVANLDERDALKANAVRELIIDTEIQAMLTELAELQSEIEAKKRQHKKLKTKLGKDLQQK